MAVPQPASAGYPPLYRSPRFELKYSMALMLLRLKPAGLDFQFPPWDGSRTGLPEDRLRDLLKGHRSTARQGENVPAQRSIVAYGSFVQLG